MVTELSFRKKGDRRECSDVFPNCRPVLCNGEVVIIDSKLRRSCKGDAQYLLVEKVTEKILSRIGVSLIQNWGGEWQWDIPSFRSSVVDGRCFPSLFGGGSKCGIILVRITLKKGVDRRFVW